MITKRASTGGFVSTPRLIATVFAGTLLTACVTQDAAAPARASAALRPLVVQGAMDVEIRKLPGALENVTEEKVGEWTFWRGTLDGYPVVISKTLKGMSNAAAATALAAERYHPAAIINQGTAGGHQPDLHVYDIVLGTDAVNLGSFKTGYRKRGEGSNFAEWNPLDLMRSDGSAGQDPNARVMRRFHGDEGLLASYSDVQFRAPVRAGDVIEVTATVTAVGRRSRQLRFEAQVVCRADPARGDSAATVLAEPIVVVTATGTVVVPPPAG